MAASVYRLSEFDEDGNVASETFPAPNDDVALDRVLEVSSADVLELWRGAQLVARVDRRPLG